MSARTIFLSRLIGWYGVLAALAMAAHRQATVDMVTAMLHNPPALFLAALFGLLGGLAIVIGHNVWSGGAATIVVTLMGWSALLKGLLLMFLTPDASVALCLGTLQYERFFYFYTAIPFGLGAFLLLAGGVRNRHPN
jgi:hypothetical protein